MQQALPFERVEQFEEELRKRGISQELTAFLLLCFQAANGTGPPGITGRFQAAPEPLYVMEAKVGQYVLAQLVGCKSDRELRRLWVPLVQQEILLKPTIRSPGISGRQTCYIVRIQKLLELPVLDTGTDLLARVCEVISTSGLSSFLDGAGSGEQQTANVEKEPAFAATISERLSMTTHTNKRMTDILDSDARKIAGFTVDKRELSISERLELFSGYWRDAKLRDNLTSTDCVELLALFLHWARHSIHPKYKAKSSNPRGATIATWWRNRRMYPLQGTLLPAELKEARKMLEHRNDQCRMTNDQSGGSSGEESPAAAGQSLATSATGSGVAVEPVKQRTTKTFDDHIAKLARVSAERRAAMDSN